MRHGNECGQVMTVSVYLAPAGYLWPALGGYGYLLVSVIDRPELPVVFNLNIGHAMPRCIIPFGVEATVDAEQQIIRFAE